MDFAIDVQLAQAARDKLRNLRAEVDDEEAFMMCHTLGISNELQNRKWANAGKVAEMGGCLAPTGPILSVLPPKGIFSRMKWRDLVF
jgi:hypothetical protein